MEKQKLVKCAICGNETPTWDKDDPMRGLSATKCESGEYLCFRCMEMD